jgi:hypothetical protein
LITQRRTCIARTAVHPGAVSTAKYDQPPLPHRVDFAPPCSIRGREKGRVIKMRKEQSERRVKLRKSKKRGYCITKYVQHTNYVKIIETSQ